MLGSIDYMHWEWKNCQHNRRECTQDGMHAFFGLPGSLNDINVLDRSSVFNLLAQGSASPVNYRVNDREYNMGYYLADGIYPQWATFVRPIPAHVGVKRQYFFTVHESYRKDVERAFRVLQSRFAIVRSATSYFERYKDIQKKFATLLHVTW
ncbi:hypothetical protein LIER_10359 [Lithospermum erythrorhizon]|uniref:Protein ALP1-like n=1 Tax=Lithospermum erythrorhizon TaxID=34254 RepID=A0AAV3PKE9_LITER